jgi:hypothetical protein
VNAKTFVMDLETAVRVVLINHEIESVKDFEITVTQIDYGNRIHTMIIFNFEGPRS